MSESTVDHYARSGRRWAAGPMRVYGPIATELVAMCPHPLAGRTVLDAGAGTGAASAALAAAGARVIASDLSPDMLAWNALSRPPAVVADVRSLPFADACVDDVVAAFVLNHLVDPQPALAELRRVCRGGGALLAAVFSNASRSAVRDRLDELVRAEGWACPDWYLDIKATAAPVLGDAAAMETALRAAGLRDIVVDERPVDVGVTSAEHLVEYRLGQAQFAAWLDEIGETRAAETAQRLADGIRASMEPYRPIVVFARATLP